MVSPSVRFPYVPRYRMYWLRQQAQTFIKDIFRGVDIPVVDCATGGAYPLPHSKVFRSCPLCAAGRAKLTGRIEAVYPLPSLHDILYVSLYRF